ncbi:MAG: exo-alpha-sialidase, partial [Planctomycetota bacterium]
MKSRSIVAILFCTLFLVPSVRGLADAPGLVSSKPIFEKVPFPECHASTIEETPSGLVAAWFGGTREGAKDVGIWVSRLRGGSWAAPVEVANGVQFTRVSPSDVRNRTVHRHPCWNPVLYYDAGAKTLLLFFL